MKLASVRIVASDLPALAAFYQTITGADLVTPFGDGKDYLELHTQSGIVAIASVSGMERNAPDAELPAANRSVILEFEVGDVDAERKRLDSIVTDWVLEPTSQPWGYRSMLFRDPDGNLINFYTPGSDVA